MLRPAAPAVSANDYPQHYVPALLQREQRQRRRALLGLAHSEHDPPKCPVPQLHRAPRVGARSLRRKGEWLEPEAGLPPPPQPKVQWFWDLDTGEWR